MWEKGWREKIWSQLDTQWDLIIVGGGITGAGILREATRGGYKALLVEANDFASGTSSRSSKLVHGGFRYLKNMQVKVTLESVTERELLLTQGKGLINRLGFLFACLEGDKTPGWVFGMGLVIYGLMARKWQYRHYDAEDMQLLCPPLTTPLLRGGYRYFDAQTDDARLTIRIIREAVNDGATAINYVTAKDLLKDSHGKVCGVVVQDNLSNGSTRTAEVKASVVINATGAWADGLRAKIGLAERMRPLRGSHLVFPNNRLPLMRAVSLIHPRDGRPVFAFPWEGVTVIGTTDVDVGRSLCSDPAISQAEAEYLLELVQFAFPESELDHKDISATWSGIRPVINTGKVDPSKESREHVIWLEDGLLTVSGGKFTTFRLMARDALRAARNLLPERHQFDRDMPVLDPIEVEVLLSESALKQKETLRLVGRYGADSLGILMNARPEELEYIANTPYLWSELRWAARSEGVVHLDDLLLRRVRLGLLLPNGAKELLPRIRSIVQSELKWDDQRWKKEVIEYNKLWNRAYKLN
jgi:glycerol-3-phosphate dehydrogenase